MFPQLKNTFPGMNSKISWNLSQFPETGEGHSPLVRCPRKFTICTIFNGFNALFKIVVHSLGVGPLTKRIEIGLRERASLKIFAFSNHKSHIFLHVYIFFSIFLNFPEFPGIFSFPKNYPEVIRISRNSGYFLQSGNTEEDVWFNQGGITAL